MSCMKKSVIFEVFDFLKQRGVVLSESDFSIEWLGQSESYFRGLRFKKTEPTLGVIAICGARLFRAGEFLSQSPYHTRLADEFFALGKRCDEIVNEDAAKLVLL